MLEDAETLDVLKDHYDGFNVREVNDRIAYNKADFAYKEFDKAEDAKKFYESERGRWDKLGGGRDASKPIPGKTPEGKYTVGYKGEQYSTETYPGNYKKNVAVFEPNKIRSKFAAFDPFNKTSANLLASGLLGSLLLNNNEPKKKPRGLLEM